MKLIEFTKEAEDKVLRLVIEKFRKEWENFKNNKNETKFTFSADLSSEAKEKQIIIYSRQAYLRMEALVDFYDSEVAWYGLVEKTGPRTYYVSDVKLCKQYVTGSKVDTTDEETANFFNSLTDEEANMIHFQAHSHVNFTTSASPVDLQNQADVVDTMKSGFYIFQIWNKKGDINTYLYDIDANILYDRKDVITDVEDDEGGVSDFLASTIELVEEKKYYPYQTTGYQQSGYQQTGYQNGGYQTPNYQTAGKNGSAGTDTKKPGTTYQYNQGNYREDGFQ